VVDTNVLVYDTFEDSLYHEAAARLLDSLDRWLIPLIVVYEYVWVLKGLNVEPAHVREKLLEYLTEEKSARL
jgi:predicted nucleic acid-binding protein